MEKINRPYKGLWMDSMKEDQPEGTYSYALNAIIDSINNKPNFISTEYSNIETSFTSPNSILLGDVYVGNKEHILFLIEGGKDIIALINTEKNSKDILVETNLLKFLFSRPIKAIYRKRFNGRRYIYWVDGMNNLRTFCIDRPKDYYSQEYLDYLATGNTSPYPSEKFRKNSFEAITYSDFIPVVEDVFVEESGSIKPGSYNFAIVQCDEDFNPTNFDTITGTVVIYQDRTDSHYDGITGSHYQFNDYFTNGRTNKSIRLQIGGLDPNLPYYRVAIIQAFNGTGNVSRVLLSEPVSVVNTNYVYAGNDEVYQEIPVTDITIGREEIKAPEFIEQQDDRLIIASTSSDDIDLCGMQKFASKIIVNWVSEKVPVSAVDDVRNMKNPKHTFFNMPYMPGEVYALNINYLLDNGTVTPGFHIPGKGELYGNSNMQEYLAGYNYNNIHNCNGTNDYWGTDSIGEPLVGTPVRHHRIPLRSNTGKALIETSSSSGPVNQYTLTVRFNADANTINNWPRDPSPIVGQDGPYSVFEVPLKIKRVGLPEETAVVELTRTSANTVMTVMVSMIDFEPVSGINLIVVDPLYHSYNFVNTNFTKIENKITTVITPSTPEQINQEANVFYLQLSNIQIPSVPGANVIGFYITRAEVTENDRVVLDNCLLGSTNTNGNYSSFSNFIPKGNPSTKYFWYLSPEEICYGKKLNISSIQPQGTFIGKPLTSNKMTDIGNSPSLGVYMEDVQAGTTYNSEVHKKREKDSDGFSLNCSYLRTDYSDFTTSNLPFVNPYLVTDNHSISPGDHKLLDGKFLFNSSLDNKIGIAEVSNVSTSANFIDTANTRLAFSNGSKTITTNYRRIVYGTIVRESPGGFVGDPYKFSYQDFMYRPFYREHQEPFYFSDVSPTDTITIKNGDAYISKVHLTSTMFNKLQMAKRSNKTSVWKYIVGAILVVGGAVLAIVTGGTGAAVSYVGVGLMAAAAGLSIIQSGLKLDNMISMMEEHYDRGLRESVLDQTALDFTNSSDPADDIIKYHADIAYNLCIESRVPIALRTPSSLALPSFLTNMSEDEAYNHLSEKLTMFDRDRGDGRLYRGFVMSELYEVNKDYVRKPKEKVDYHLSTQYDCCTDTEDRRVNRIYWSEKSFSGEFLDRYATFLPNNYKDISGETGGITNLFRYADKLFIHTEEALYQLPSVIQERSTNELTSYLGTGDYFSIPEMQLIDDTLSAAGSSSRWATYKTKNGVLFVSTKENKIALLGQGIKYISDAGIKSWSEDNIRDILREFLASKGYKFNYSDSSHLTYGCGFRSAYDYNLNRFLITKKDFDIVDRFKDTLEFRRDEFPNASDGSDPVYSGWTIREFAIRLWYCEYNSRFYLESIYGNGVDSRGFLFLVDDFSSLSEVFVDKSFTISYNMELESWTSFHSYLPLYYISTLDNVYSMSNGRYLYKHLVKDADTVLEFYDYKYPFIVEVVSNQSPVTTKISENITYMSKAHSLPSKSVDLDVTFDSCIIYNSTQSSGELIIEPQTENEHMFDFDLNEDYEVVRTVRREFNWSLNGFRAMNVYDPESPMFSSNWSDIKGVYPIDKVPVQLPTIDWSEQSVFKDKYLVIRYYFNNFVNKTLTFQYYSVNEKQSE